MADLDSEVADPGSEVAELDGDLDGEEKNLAATWTARSHILVAQILASSWTTRWQILAARTMRKIWTARWKAW